MQDEYTEYDAGILNEEEMATLFERDARRYPKAFSEEEEAKHR